MKTAVLMKMAKVVSMSLLNGSVKLTQSHVRRVGEYSYVLHAFEVGPDGKLDRKMLTEYKIDNSLSLGSLKISLLSKQVTWAP